MRALCLALALVSLASGCQPAETGIDCRLHITLSGAVHGTFEYGSWVNSKECTSSSGDDSFSLGWGQDDLPAMGMWACGISFGALGTGYADLSVQANGLEWSSYPVTGECGPSSICEIEVTRNDLNDDPNNPPIAGHNYWVEGSGTCAGPIPPVDGNPEAALTVEGTFTFAAEVGLWE